MKDIRGYRKLSVQLIGLIVFALCAIYFFRQIIPESGSRRTSRERRAQRKLVEERVQTGGGWAALKRDCDSLVGNYKNNPDGFRWLRRDTNALPPAIAALKPKEVEFYSPNILREFQSGDGYKWFGSNLIVRISLFGAHSTGGHDEPWLGLDVVCEPGLGDYSPSRLRSSTPLRYWQYRKIAADVYEFC